MATRATNGAIARTTETIFERLLDEILSGSYPAGSRLPPERELAATLDASRASLREAFARLSAWGLIESRRGSGVSVRPPERWSFRVLPRLLERTGQAIDVSMVEDLLATRRSLALALLADVPPRLAGRNLSVVRQRIETAWAARNAVNDFVRCDFDVLRQVLQEAELWPALWLLNDLGDVYLQLATRLTDVAFLSPSYRETLLDAVTALEAGHSKRALRLLCEYLEDNDRRRIDQLARSKNKRKVAR